MRSRAISRIKAYQLSRNGEEFIAAWFIERGFKLLQKNFRRPGCELDLVLCRGAHLLIVEVKARRQPSEDLQQLVPPRKQKALRRGVERLLSENPEWLDLTIHLGLAVISGIGTDSEQVQWIRLPDWDDLTTERL